ncbi:MAG: helix-turn-helix domain-containing protein [Candidatus Methylacidiphilales bacterium]|nr:helix-turn-helix domain-containing protein [Candidatus Methylacidiphilales bacterium]
MKTNKDLVARLADSELFRGYQESYSTATGMPLILLPLENVDLSFSESAHQNPFCRLMTKTSRLCAACLQMQNDLREKAFRVPATTMCVHGLCEAAVPVRNGEEVIGFFQTGQVFLKTPKEAEIERVLENVASLGLDIPSKALRKTYLRTLTIPQKQFSAMLQILVYFAETFSGKCSQLLVAESSFVHPIAVKAKAVIQQRYKEDISLSWIANQVHASPFHLCKVFREFVGMTFTDYLSRTRIEHAKELLVKRNLSVSEIAYEVGFRSLTHFNRCFKAIVGKSPTQYRKHILFCRLNFCAESVEKQYERQDVLRV